MIPSLMVGWTSLANRWLKQIFPLRKTNREKLRPAQVPFKGGSKIYHLQSWRHLNM